MLSRGFEYEHGCRFDGKGEAPNEEETERSPGTGGGRNVVELWRATQQLQAEKCIRKLRLI
jgi:hypothetical protein